MIIDVRTTLVIDDALLRRAKIHAARHGVTLSALVERALRDELRESSSSREASPPYRVPTFGARDRSQDHEPGELTAALLEEDELGLRRGGPR